MAAKVLQDKIAIVFGAGGSIGAAVAKEFMTEGAEVFLAGRNPSSVDSVLRRIAPSGGKAHAATVAQWWARIVESNFLRTTATVRDTANAAVLIASDRARMLTGTVVNATAGAALD